jgi:DNA polymerase II small subunit/DNA polymerase delta subunit B
MGPSIRRQYYDRGDRKDRSGHTGSASDRSQNMADIQQEVDVAVRIRQCRLRQRIRIVSYADIHSRGLLAS